MRPKLHRNASQRRTVIETGEQVVPSSAQTGPVCYLIMRAAKFQRMKASLLLRPLNLYAGQELLLMQLFERDRQKQIELVDRLQLDASTVTKMVQRLEAQGIVEKANSETDGRAVVIALTEQGQSLRNKISKMWTELEAFTTASLTKKEQTDLFRSLEKIVIGMRET